jgi:glycosyltransferase involved in cell wall biosynthesis
LTYFKGKIPIYFRGDSHNLNDNFFLKKIIRTLFLRAVYKFIDFAHYVGSNNYNYFKKNGLKENQLIFVPHAVENNRFSTVYSNNLIHKNENEIVFGFAGKLDSVKNPFLLAKAFMEIKNERIKLIFAGEGKLLFELKEYCKLDTRISFMGFLNQTEMPKFYQAIDVFVLPSISETWGLSVNEAMASSKAIIVSDKVGCAIDLVIDNFNGYIFKSNNISSLKNVIERCLRSDLKQMGLNSFNIIQKWTIEKQAEAIERSIYERSIYK